MSEVPEKVSLVNLGRGAAIEKFDIEFARVLANIMDPNTKATERTITLQVKIKPDDNRTFATAEITCKTALAAAPGFAVQMFIGWKTQIYSAVRDRVAPFRVLREIAETTRGRVGASRDPEILARALQAAPSQAETMLNDGVVDAKTGEFRNVKPLMKILKPFRDVIDDLQVLLLLRRAVELTEAAHGDASETATRLGKAGNLLLGQFATDLKEAKAQIATIEAASPEMAAAVRDIYAWNDAVVDFFVESGRVPAHVADAIRKYRNCSGWFPT